MRAGHLDWVRTHTGFEGEKSKMGEMAPRLMGPDDWGGMEDAGDAITGGAVVSPAADTITGFLPSGRALDGEADSGAGRNRYNAGSAQHGPDHSGGRDFIQLCDLLERSGNFMDAPMGGSADPDRFDMEGSTSNFGNLVEQGGTQTRVSCSLVTAVTWWSKQVRRRESSVALVTAVRWWSKEVRRRESRVALVTAVLWWSTEVRRRESRVALVTAVIWWSQEVRRRQSRVALVYSSTLVEPGGAQTSVSCSSCHSSNLVEQGGMQATVSCSSCHSSTLVEHGGTRTRVSCSSSLQQ